MNLSLSERYPNVSTRHDLSDLRHRATIEQWFEHHEVRVEGAPGLQRLVWGRPNTTNRRVVYTFSGKLVFVSGDLYTAVYELTAKAIPENLGDMDFGYFTSKMRVAEQGETTYDEKVASRAFLRSMLETDIPYALVCEAKDALLNGVEDGAPLTVVLDQLADTWALERDIDLSTTDWYHDYTTAYEHALRAGDVPTIHTEAYWLGLQYAIAALQAPTSDDTSKG